MNASPLSLPLYAGHGIEIEVMIVDRATLEVRPVADELLAELAGEIASDALVTPGIGASNELVRHVIELKNEDPRTPLAELPGLFRAAVRRLDQILAPKGLALLPGAAHPWMDPRRETVLWPHEGCEVYAAYDRVFDCRRHGWANLQSVHVNLSFGNEEEFGRLHAACRAVLPLVPALAAASPYLDGARAENLDQRLATYFSNAAKVPEMTGAVIPEPIYGIDEYHEKIFEPLYRAMAPHDEDEIFGRNLWLNARGAIARFDRNAIEIRLVDAQEEPGQDLAVAAAVTAVVRALCEERWMPAAKLKALGTAPLRAILDATTHTADQTRILDESFLAAFGRDAACDAGALWGAMLRELLADGLLDASFGTALALILDEGPLARRLVAVGGEQPTRASLTEVLRRLQTGLIEGTPFRAKTGARPQL